jgi:uncharacterized protein with HEPN domain
MTRHDPLVRVRHMLEHADEAHSLAKVHVREDLDSDRLFHLAMLRLLEVIGEAASHVPADFRERFPDVPWRNIIDLRNRLIHGYDNINHDILWNILSDELPELIIQLKSIVRIESE